MPICLRYLGMLDGANFIALTNGFPGRDFDPPRLHRLRQFALQLDLQETLIERSALHPNEVGEVEAALERAAGNAVIEIFALVLLGIRLAADDQRVLVDGDADLVRLETGDRDRDPVVVLAGPYDIAGWIMVLRFKPKACVHQVQEAVEAYAGAPEGV